MTANQPTSRRMPRRTLYILATSITLLIYAALMFFARTQPWLIWPALAFALIAVVLACFWMLALDEAAQQAHYIAWFWGGSAGLLASMLAFVTVMLQPKPFEPLLAVFGETQGFALGIAVGIVPPVIGYVIWWAVLWLRRS
jgi:hypothetical protein